MLWQHRRNRSKRRAICRKNNRPEPKTRALQGAAREIYTLRQVEPQVEERFAGPKGMVEGAPIAAVEQYLHEEPYQEGELEGLLGIKLDDLFAGNSSQLRSVAFARKNGERTPQEKSITPASTSFASEGLLQLQHAVLLSSPSCDSSRLHEGCLFCALLYRCVNSKDAAGCRRLQAAAAGAARV